MSEARKGFPRNPRVSGSQITQGKALAQFEETLDVVWELIWRERFLGNRESRPGSELRFSHDARRLAEINRS